MKEKIYIISILACFNILSAYSQYPGDMIELSSAPADGGEIKACHSLVLKPGFNFAASLGHSLTLKVDPRSA
jgi:hypothetical protein